MEPMRWTGKNKYSRRHSARDYASGGKCTMGEHVIFYYIRRDGSRDDLNDNGCDGVFTAL
jgi:hypothetical protein